MVTPFCPRVAQADEKFKGLQLFSFFVKDVSLPQPGSAIGLANDRIGSTCDLIFSFLDYLALLQRKNFANSRPL